MTPALAERMNAISAFHVMSLLQRGKQLEAQGRDVIHMEIGEPDFPSPVAVMDAGCEFIRTGHVKYTAPAGLPALREAIAQFYQSHYGVTVPARRIFVTPGASGAFLIAFAITLNSGQTLMMADPCYPCNENFLQLLGAKAQYVPVDAGSRFHLDHNLVNTHWQTATAGVLIASPANPTGTVIDTEQFSKIIQFVDTKQGYFFSDEIYHGLTYDNQAETALRYSQNAFVVNSFSKYFGMTGWRIGWLVVPETFVEAAEKIAQNVFISTSTHSQYAALAAFQPHNLSELDRRRDEFQARRDFLYAELTRLGFKIRIKPDGAFYLYADCSAFTQNSFQFAQDLLETEAVAVTPGIDFGEYNANTHIRFAYTVAIERMREAITRMERFICR
jgi:aspartate/methionine/tyrosine aminotransferase